MCRYRLGWESKRDSPRELRPLQTIWAGSAICTAGERCRQVGIVGSLPGREQKVGATSALILSHMRYEMAQPPLFFPPHISLGLWFRDSKQEKPVVFDLARQRISTGRHLSGMVVLFFDLIRAMTKNTSWIFYCRGAPSPPPFWTHSSHLLIFFLCTHLCWNTAEALPFYSMLLSFSSFSHNLTPSLFSLPLQRDYLWTSSSCCILTVSNS